MKRTRICQTAGAFAVLAAAGLLTGCSKADTGALGADNKLYVYRQKRQRSNIVFNALAY